jgi:translation initiation factor 3 subunit A
LKLQALEKEKNQLGEQLRIAGKRIDHLERAYRKEEIKHLKTDYEKQQEADLAAYEKAKAEELKEAEEKHKEDVALKHRLSRLVSPYQQFVNTVKQQRKTEFEKRQKIAQKELENKKAARVKEVKERMAREKREREEAERRQREEEEREREEAEAKAKAEEERRTKMLEEKAKRDEERRSVPLLYILDRRLTFRSALMEKARLQAQREEEAMAKRRAGAGPSRAVPDRTISREPAAESPSAGGPPRLALAGNKPTWREREAMKASGQAPPAASTSPAPAPAATSLAPAASEAEAPKRSGYVPPALRQAGGAPSSGWRGREDSGSGRAPPARAERPERTESPATGGRYEPARGGGRWGAESSDRKASPANAGGWVPPARRGDAPAREGDGERESRPPAQAPAGGKYVPRFRRGEQ